MIDDTVRWLMQMHQPHEFEAVEPTRFEREFEREFGVGDEQQHKPRRIDQEMFGAGHKASDFS